VLATKSSMSVPICNHFRARQANSGKIVVVGVLFSPLIHGAPLTQQREILSHNTRDTKLSYGVFGENPKSLSHLGLDQYQVVTDRQNYHS